MSEFFEPPPPPPEPPKRHRQPPWAGPPQWTLPGAVSLELVLVHSEQVAIAVTRVSAYPTGFDFDLLALAAPNAEAVRDMEPMLFGPARHRAMQGPGLSPEVLRIGIQFADGSKATNLGGFPPPPGREEPSGPIMQQRGGGGGAGHWHQNLWVWPLPPPGALAFVCEWPAFDVALTRRELDAQPILDAAERAQVIFTEDDEL